MALVRAADFARERLSLAARRLGTADPSGPLGELLEHSFEHPLGDPRYRGNTLCPGCAIPLEHSFDEMSASSLRLGLEAVPGASPDTRRHETTRAMRGLVDRHFGTRALSWFDQSSEVWRGMHAPGDQRFGAWFGASFDEAGLQTSKVYYECTRDQLEALPPNLRHAARVAMACLPALVPAFVSVACGRAQGAQRIYFYHNADLRLLDLEPLMNRLGVGHQLPGLLTAVGLILGGRFVLPRGSVILGIRDTSKGFELKMHLVVPEVPDAPAQMHGLIQMHLAQRPGSQRAMRNWFQAMTPDHESSPGAISVVGIRITPALAGRLTVYFTPVGYDRPSARSRGARRDDPYAANPYAST